VRLLVVADTDPTGARIAALRDLGVDVTFANPSPLAGVRAGLALRRGSAAQTIVEVAFPGPTLGAWLAARLARVPLVVRVRDTGSPEAPAGASALRRARLVVTTSRAAAAALSAAVPQLAGRVVVESLGVDTEPFRSDPPVGGDEGSRPAGADRRRAGIVVAGPLTAGSGVDVVLDAMGAIDADGRPAVTILGHGAESDALHARAEGLGVAVDWQPDDGPDRVIDAIRSASIVVVPPRSEPEATRAIQGMAAGAVVVAAASGSLREIVDDGRNGILVESRDPAALAAGIRRALIVARGDDRLRLMRTAASTTAAEHDVRTVARRTLDRYRALGG
jgi:D-inositol-3-phosphate glycosyltransferase